MATRQSNNSAFSRILTTFGNWTEYGKFFEHLILFLGVLENVRGNETCIT